MAKRKSKATKGKVEKGNQNIDGIVQMGKGKKQQNNGKKGKDPELEMLEIKRKAVVVKNKWLGKLEELDQEVTIALSRAHPFAEDCQEFFGCTAVSSPSIRQTFHVYLSTVLFTISIY